MASPTTSFLWRSALGAGLGGILFGFDVSVIAGANDLMKAEFDLTPWQVGFTASSALWSAMAGILIAGLLSDRLGRCESLKLAAVLFFVSAVGCGIAWDWWSLVFFRALGGFGVGASAVLAPMYIAEIAPRDRRGLLVCFFQFSIVLGILVAYISNLIVGQQGYTSPVEWRVKFACEAFPAALFFLALFTIPRSPRWLAGRGRADEARATLVRLGETEPDRELDEITRSILDEQGQARDSILQPKYFMPLLLAFIVGLFNNLAGINGVMYYINTIFENAGSSKSWSEWQAVIIGATNLVFTVLAMFCIDRLGRKKLLLIGAAGLAPILLSIAAILHFKIQGPVLLILLMLYIAFFAFSQGAVIWVYLSEIFPNRVRNQGMSLGSFNAWMMGSMVAWLFPILQSQSAALPFVIFGVSMAINFVLVLLLFPETKGVALEDMEQTLGIGE